MSERRVQVFTASGTFRGETGTVEERTMLGAWVRLDEGSDRLFFKRGELVFLEEEHFAGAE